MLLCAILNIVQRQVFKYQPIGGTQNKMDEDIIKLTEQIDDLQKKQSKLIEKLAMVGFNIDTDLDSDVLQLVDDCAMLEFNTGVFNLDQNYLDEYYIGKMYEKIEYEYTKDKLEAELAEIQNDLKKETADVAKLEKFLEVSEKRILTEDQKDAKITEIEGKMERLRERKKSYAVPKDLDIDELVRKVEVLMSLKEQDSKKKAKDEKPLGSSKRKENNSHIP